MSTSAPVIEPVRPTLAATKLSQAVERAGSPRALGRKVGSTAQTVTLHSHGLARPNARTIERYQQVLGISPLDWFTAMPVDVSGSDPVAPGSNSDIAERE
ncbi:MAG: hypothetical protein ACLQVI_03615 [Polyangiaceae bacterium]